ncbi:hypothetical protein BKA69DRAFT_1070481 [Paraphysoderma sedebokerense]|nr:hypothetical protein BKA69DRAFT_1070481 [Paraphysoderma sedebokerense]
MTKITVFIAILCVLVAFATLTLGDASPGVAAEGYQRPRCAIGYYHDGKRCILRKKGSGPYKDGKFSGKAAEPGYGNKDGHDYDYGKKDRDYNRDYKKNGRDGYGNYDRKHDNNDKGRRYGKKHD